jgi:exodeoxyribonuclease VIII
MKLLLQDLIKLHDQDKLSGQFDISNEDYHVSPGYSASNLIDVLKYSEAHLKYFKEHPDQENDAFRIGTMIHTAVLEPQEFNKNYIVAPTLDKRTKDGKAAYDKFSSENQGKQLISKKEYDMAMDIQKSVLSTSTAKVLLNDAIIERSFFTRTFNDLLLKARPDAINTKLKVLVDLKTTTNCSDFNIRNSIKDYMYFLQSVVHMFCVNAVMGDNTVTDIVYIFVEKSEPYGCKFVTISQDDIAYGMNQMALALGKIRKALDTGKFPGYSEEIISLNIFGGDK